MAPHQSSINEVGDPDKFSWRITAPLSLTSFVVIIYIVALGPFIKEIADEMNVSVALVGQVNTVILVAMGFCGLIVGPLADHYGHKRAIVTGLAVMSVSALVVAVATSYWLLLVAGFIAGVAASMTFVMFGLAAASFKGPAQRKALSQVQAAQAVGSTLGAPILTTIAAFTIWRGAYVFSALLLALACLLVGRLITMKHPWPESRASLANVLDAYRPLLVDRSMLRLFAASGFRALGWIGPLLYLGAFLIEVHNLSLRQVGLCYMVASGGIFIGNVLAGGPVLRVGLRTLFVITTTGMGAGWFVIYLVNPPILFSLLALAFSATNCGIAWVCMTSLLAAETPAGPATTMVLNMSIFAFSSAIGVALAGALIAFVDFQAIGFAFPLFTMIAVGIIWRPRLMFAPSTDTASAD